jgi:hypothetical protein
VSNKIEFQDFPLAENGLITTSLHSANTWINQQDGIRVFNVETTWEQAGTVIFGFGNFKKKEAGIRVWFTFAKQQGEDIQ